MQRALVSIRRGITFARLVYETGQGVRRTSPWTQSKLYLAAWCGSAQLANCRLLYIERCKLKERT